MDTKRHPIWFRFSYMLPQILGILIPCLAILSIWLSNWWLAALSGLIVAILPLPAYWRSEWEFRGYAASMAVRIWMGESVEDFKCKVVKHFTGRIYFFMWPFKQNVVKRLKNIEKQIRNGQIFTIDSFECIYDAINTSHLES